MRKRRRGGGEGEGKLSEAAHQQRWPCSSISRDGSINAKEAIAAIHICTNEANSNVAATKDDSSSIKMLKHRVAESSGVGTKSSTNNILPKAQSTKHPHWWLQLWLWLWLWLWRCCCGGRGWWLRLWSLCCCFSPLLFCLVSNFQFGFMDCLAR